MLHIDRHAAERVDHLLEPLKVDHGVVANGNIDDAFRGFYQEGGSAEAVRVVDAVGIVVGYVHPQVARDGEHAHRVRFGIDRGDQHGIGMRELVRPLVETDHDDVNGVGTIPRDRSTLGWYEEGRQTTRQGWRHRHQQGGDDEEHEEQRHQRHDANPQAAGRNGGLATLLAENVIRGVVAGSSINSHTQMSTPLVISVLTRRYGLDSVDRDHDLVTCIQGHLGHSSKVAGAHRAYSREHLHGTSSSHRRPN